MNTDESRKIYDSTGLSFKNMHAFNPFSPARTSFECTKSMPYILTIAELRSALGTGVLLKGQPNLRTDAFDR